MIHLLHHAYAIWHPLPYWGKLVAILAGIAVVFAASMAYHGWMIMRATGSKG